MTNSQLEQLKWAIAQIREKIEGEFYGELAIKLQAGRIAQLEVKESKKPPA